MGKINYAFAITQETLDRVRAHALQQDRSVAWVIRDALDKYLETKEKETRRASAGSQKISSA